MMCARMLKSSSVKLSPCLEILPFNPLENFIDKFRSDEWLIRVENTYDYYLRLSLSYRHYVVIGAFAFAALGYLIHQKLPL